MSRVSFVHGIVLACIPVAALHAAPPREIRIASLGARGATFRDDPPWRLVENISRAGDVNGDGLADFLLLRRGPDGSEVLVVHGRRDGFPAEPSMAELRARSTVIVRGPWSDSEGLVDAAGDIDGDGFDDILLLRAPGPVQGNVDAVHLVYGASDLPAEFSIHDPPPGARTAVFVSTKSAPTDLCLDVETGGDLDGDGAPDIVFAAGFSRTGFSVRYPQGRVYVLYGDGPFEGTIDVDEIGVGRRGFILEGSADGEGLGRVAKFAGDVNGDGVDDLLVGANSFSGGAPDSAYLVWGGDDLPDFIRANDLLDDGRGVRFIGAGAGATLAAPGDLDGDGLADFLIGAPSADGHRGAVYLVYGREDFPELVSLVDVVSLGLGAKIAGSFPRPPADVPPHVATQSGRAGQALDVIRHGGGESPDLLVGAPYYEVDGLSDVGRVTIVHDIAFAPGTYPIGDVETGELPGVLLSCEEQVRFGSTAAAVGDVNGDGLDDYLLSAPEPESDDVPPEIYLVWGVGDAPDPIAIDGVAPPVVSLSGGTELTVFGAGFDDGTEVFVGGRAAVVLRVETTARLVIEAPPGAALDPVDVEARRGAEVASLTGGLRYIERVWDDVEAVDIPGAGAGTRLEGPQSMLEFADVDGDGFDDVISRLPGLGGVSVVYGRARPPSEIDLPDPSRGGGGSEGASLLWETEATAWARPVAVGDVNGDGGTDVAVISSGHVAVVFGGRRWPREAWIDELVADGDAASIIYDYDGFNFPTVGGGGDLDGDGIGDLLVRLRDDILGEFATIHIVPGLARWPRERPLDGLPVLRSAIPEDRFGSALSIVGDLDGDGRDELLAGAQGRFYGADGNAYLVRGGLPLVSELTGELVERGAAIRFDAAAPKDSLGHEVCEIGDFNGDGFTDFAVSAEGGGIEFAGESYVVFGGPGLDEIAESNVVSMAVLGEHGLRIPGHYGYDYADSVRPAGDFNGDGLDDLLVATSGGRARPTVYVIFGGAAGQLKLSEHGGFAVRIFCPSDIGHDFGGGDFNGDGRDDVLVAGERDGAVLTSSYILLGAGGDARFIRGDVDGDGTIVITDPIALLGALFLGDDALECEDAGDANDDGGLDIADAVWILSHLYLGGPPPPPPYPDPGRDPTVDGLGCLR